MNDKKFLIANRLSFIFFSLYLLTYVLLPILEKNANYLWFLIFPIIFFIGLIINLAIKYNKMKLSTMEKVSQIATIVYILFNGFVASSLYASTMNWSNKEAEIKKYPSITPTLIFVILFATVLYNFVVGLFLSSDTLISGDVILISSIISIIFILLGLVSSTFALYYNNGKKETWRFWKIIIIVIMGLIVIAIYSAYRTGFSIKDEIHKKYEKETFEEHKKNIERTLNNS